MPNVSAENHNNDPRMWYFFTVVNSAYKDMDELGLPLKLLSAYTSTRIRLFSECNIVVCPSNLGLVNCLFWFWMVSYVSMAHFDSVDELRKLLADKDAYNHFLLLLDQVKMQNNVNN